MHSSEQKFILFRSQHISFLMVGVLVVTSIRGLLINLTKFFYAISSSKTSNAIVMFFAQLMGSVPKIFLYDDICYQNCFFSFSWLFRTASGMYFVSSVLLMRMNVPPKYRTIITEVLGNLQDGFLIFLIKFLNLAKLRPVGQFFRRDYVQ